MYLLQATGSYGGWAHCCSYTSSLETTLQYHLCIKSDDGLALRRERESRMSISVDLCQFPMWPTDGSY